VSLRATNGSEAILIRRRDCFVPPRCARGFGALLAMTRHGINDRCIRLRIVFVLLGLMPSLIISPSVFALEDAIIAVVNEEVITLKDLRDYAHALVVQMKAEGIPGEEIKAAMADLEVNGIDRLIENKLILNEANRLKIEADKPTIDAKMNDIRRGYPSEAAFLDAMIAEGSTPADLRKKISEQIKIRRTIEQEVKEKTYVNPQDVTAYYKEHFDEYAHPERVSVDSIYIPKGADENQSKEKAEEALAKIKTGMAFGDVAKEFSKGPNIGVVMKGQLLPMVESILFTMKENTTSDIVEVAGGFYIFRVKEHLQEDIAQLEEIKEKIIDVLFEKKFREKYRQWVDKLQEKTFVDIKGQK